MGIHTNKKLPKFDSPPVIETAISVSFNPLEKWGVPHFGLYWNRIRANYPHCQIHPPLPEEIERFGETGKQISLSFGPTKLRSWFVSETGDWLIQVQDSRFVSNWRKTEGAKYPNFKGFKEHFSMEWERFRNFLQKESIPYPDVAQVEVSYVNHIDIGGDFGELEKIFNTWSNTLTGQVLHRPPEGVAINSVYLIPEDRGRLYIAIAPVIRHADLQQIIQFRLTANVLVASNTLECVLESMDIAHEWVVSGFADFTTAAMHKKWGRKQ